MSKFNRANMFKPGEVPVELQKILKKLTDKVSKWNWQLTNYLCLELTKGQQEQFEPFIKSFINNRTTKELALRQHAHGLTVLLPWYNLDAFGIVWDYADANNLRQEFLEQALANIEEQEKAKIPRAKKMSDTKLYKTLKAKVGAEYMKSTVTPALRKVWNQRDAIEYGANFDTDELICAFDWSSTESPDFWLDLDKCYFE